MAYPVANVKPLDGAEGYLRWKESMLLLLHTVGVAHVLSEDRPAGDDAAPAPAKKWARDNAICRGEILAALSDHVFPDYVRHAEARELWQAVARTYDVDTSGVSRLRFIRFEFDEEAPLLEQIAHVEALAADMGQTNYPDGFLASSVSCKLPTQVAKRLADIPATRRRSSTEGVPLCQIFDEEIGMSKVWDVARAVEKTRMEDGLRGILRDEEEEMRQF